MIKTVDYCLPDSQLLDKKTNQYIIWIPDAVYIVLGASNDPNTALNVDHVVQDNVTVLKRPSGGQAVVLTPNTLILSAVFLDRFTLHSTDVFQHVNAQIIAAIEQSGVQHLFPMGISDIAISGKKIVGSAIYKNKQVLLYHAVINVAEPATTFERYLKHPSKEPAYRKGRTHSEFITSLTEKGYTKSIHQLARELSASFDSFFCLSK